MMVFIRASSFCIVLKFLIGQGRLGLHAVFVFSLGAPGKAEV